METIVYDRLTNGQVRQTYNPDAVSYEENIISIDNEIELRVRGDLPETKILNAATSFMEQKMARYLEYEYDQFRLPNYTQLDGVLSFDTGDQKNRAFEEVKRFHEQKFSELAQLKAKSHRKNKFLFSIEPGFEIIIPPFDCGWSNRFTSFSTANKISGLFKSVPDGRSYGGSGIGVFLSPTTDVSARFNAHCPISYSWSNFIGDGGGYAASRGGVGITIYNASQGILLKDDHEILWNQSRRPSELEFGAGSDDLYFQNTSNGHSYFEMKAGSTYLIWLWCWAFADSGPNAASYANIECKVPFMIVDASTLQ